MIGKRGHRLQLTEPQIDIPGVTSLGRYDYVDARNGLPPHSHRGSFEINLLVKGRQTYRVGNRVHRLKGGDQFVTFPDEVHDSAGAPQEKGVLYWLVLDLEKKSSQAPLLLGREAAEILRKELGKMPSRHFRANPGSREALDRAFAALTGQRTPFQRLVAAHSIAAYLCRTIEASHTNAIPEVSPLIQASLDFLAGQVEEWVPVSFLAEKTGLSESRFKARFRQEMGMPPGEFMIRRKIETAQARLSIPGETVTEVAHSLGFSTSQYFATVFKRYTLKTPSEFIAHLPSCGSVGTRPTSP